MQDHKNTILAVVLSAIVLIVWQYFFAVPQIDKQRQAAQQQTQQSGSPTPAVPGAQPTQPSALPQLNVPQVPGTVTPAAASPAATREAALQTSPRIAIDTPSLRGSIALKGGRLDDIALIKYRETVDPKSPAIVLLSPSGSAGPFYAEFGWVGAAGSKSKLPSLDTLWTQQGSGALAVGKPVTLTYNNGEGLEFTRTISVDEKYLFTIKDDVANKGTEPAALHPYGLISRHGTPHTQGFYILHEGMIGVLGDQGLQEISYSSVEEKKSIPFDVSNGWLGITDKYWAAALLPAPGTHLKARFSSGLLGTTKTYQADFLLDTQTVAPGATVSVSSRLFAGAKEFSAINSYKDQYKIDRFDLLIDWGWFYFITKPLFQVMEYFYHLVGNFGVAILIVTVLIKIAFFPLANKSYASMAKMKAVQPQMLALRERYPDDKQKQQQELMALYKEQKINPLAGCLPILVQIPVFFALYKVLFVTIEMRHAPFFGWIKDLAAPDPTNLFNLFGLLPFDPLMIPVIGSFLHLGVWPIIMGITMFVQMKLNPSPPDPTQKLIFDWMPVIFTFMLATFPAGLVIYWAWNNTLSVLQQSFIMRKHGTKIELFDNIKSVFVRKKTDP